MVRDTCPHRLDSSKSIDRHGLAIMTSTMVATMGNSSPNLVAEAGQAQAGHQNSSRPTFLG
jgi:hypothetical protein